LQQAISLNYHKNVLSSFAEKLLCLFLFSCSEYIKLDKRKKEYYRDVMGRDGETGVDMYRDELDKDRQRHNVNLRKRDFDRREHR